MMNPGIENCRETQPSLASCVSCVLCFKLCSVSLKQRTHLYSNLLLRPVYCFWCLSICGGCSCTATAAAVPCFGCKFDKHVTPFPTLLVVNLAVLHETPPAFNLEMRKQHAVVVQWPVQRLRTASRDRNTTSASDCLHRDVSRNHKSC